MDRYMDTVLCYSCSIGTLKKVGFVLQFRHSGSKKVCHHCSGPIWRSVACQGLVASFLFLSLVSGPGGGLWRNSQVSNAALASMASSCLLLTPSRLALALLLDLVAVSSTVWSPLSQKSHASSFVASWVRGFLAFPVWLFQSLTVVSTWAGKVPCFLCWAGIAPSWLPRGPPAQL